MVKKPFDAEVAVLSDQRMEELLYYSGFVGLTGPVVSATARKDLIEDFKLPKGYVNTKIRRDGNESHITINTKEEMNLVIIPRFMEQQNLSYQGAVEAIPTHLQVSFPPPPQQHPPRVY